MKIFGFIFAFLFSFSVLADQQVITLNIKLSNNDVEHHYSITVWPGQAASLSEENSSGTPISVLSVLANFTDKAVVSGIQTIDLNFSFIDGSAKPEEFFLRVIPGEPATLDVRGDQKKFSVETVAFIGESKLSASPKG